MGFETLNKLSLNELVTTLHDLITSFGRGVDKLVQKNRELSIADIDELREHIEKRLERGEEKVENEKLLKLIALFKEDKKAFDLVREDVDEWLSFLNAISKHVEKGLTSADKGEQVQFNRIMKDLVRLQDAMRKND